MQIFTTYSDGKMHKAWDIDTRTYTEYADDEAGTVMVTRPFDANENADADAWLAIQQVDSTEANLQSALTNGISSLKAMIGANTDPPQFTTLWGIRNTDNATINANPAPYINALAIGMTRLTKAVIYLARLVVKDFLNADVSEV